MGFRVVRGQKHRYGFAYSVSSIVMCILKQEPSPRKGDQSNKMSGIRQESALAPTPPKAPAQFHIP